MGAHHKTRNHIKQDSLFSSNQPFFQVASGLHIIEILSIAILKPIQRLQSRIRVVLILLQDMPKAMISLSFYNTRETIIITSRVHHTSKLAKA